MGKRGTHARPASERFWSHVQVRGEDECWPWLGYVSPTGYGRFDRRVAHRFAFEDRIGPVPSGLDLDHLCHKEPCKGGPTCIHRRCVNPRHLQPVTRSDNLLRGTSVGGNREAGAPAVQRSKTHCPRGHAYTAGNTYVLPSRPNARYCRQCHLEHTRERRARARALVETKTH